MKHLPKDDIQRVGGAITEREQLVAYLLGELPLEEQIRIEQTYFVDDAAYEQLLVVEDELAFDYLEGRLSAGRRARFEGGVGATERGRKNVEFARALLSAIRSSQTFAARRGYWAAGIAAALALLALPVWQTFRLSALTAQIEALRADNTASRARFEKELAATISLHAPEPVEAAFLLTPGQSRSGDGPARLELSSQATRLRFELIPPPGAAGGDYAVAIRTAEDAEVWSQSATFSGRTWTVQAPVKLFPGGGYKITVRRLTAGQQAPDLATYSFRLIPK